jgi:phage terminase large subunit-like protein
MKKKQIRSKRSSMEASATTKTTPEKYIEGVLDGSIVVSKFVRQAIERHTRDLETAHQDGLRFDRAKGQRVIDFFHNFLHHSKGEWAGQSFILSPWQQAFLWILFGWVHIDTGFRRFRFAYNELARGAGKSTLAAGVALYLLTADGEGGAELYSAATKKDQAKLVHSEAMRMVKKSPFLRKNITSFRDSLSILRSASKFIPLASDEDSLDGLNPHGIIADEVHAWKQRHLWDVLVTALGKRRQPLLFAITTAGFDRTSVCYEQHTYSEKVLNGTIKDNTWFAWIAGLDEGDDPSDERNWVKANPDLGVIVKWDELRTAHNKAKEDPGAWNAFLRLRLNVWTNSSFGWMNMDRWYACKEDVNPDALKGRPCFGGMDLSTVSDISAFVLVFPPYDGDTLWRILPRLYLPKDTIQERSKKAHLPYDGWAKAGHFQLTPGSVIDFDFIRNDISSLADVYDIKEIGFDRWNSHQIVTQLTGDGMLMVPIAQGAQSLNAPTKAVMEKVLKGEIAHGNQPVMNWMVSNAVAVYDANNNVRLDKAKSSEKIDGVAAMINAFARAIVVPIKPKPVFRAQVW